MNQMLTDIMGNTVIVEDINTLLASMGRTSKQKINKGTVALNDMLDHILIFLEHFPQSSSTYIIFANEYGTFFTVDHMLGQKKSQ